MNRINGSDHPAHGHPTCSTCKWWVPSGNAGNCHGGPPSAVLVPQQNPITGEVIPAVKGCWPPTSGADFCGAHVARIATPAV